MTVSAQQLKHLFHESNLIEGYDIPAFDKQQVVAWKVLLDVKFGELNHGHICKVQKILTLKQNDLRPDWRGYYRDQSGQDVWIGGRKPLDPAKIKVAMSNWLSMYTFTHPHAAHVEFERIHPFVDGNGRTGRLLLWWSQMRRGEPLTEITFADRYDYYAWFK
jgi:Fic family protein